MMIRLRLNAQERTDKQPIDVYFKLIIFSILSV